MKKVFGIFSAILLLSLLSIPIFISDYAQGSISDEELKWMVGDKWEEKVTYSDGSIMIINTEVTHEEERNIGKEVIDAIVVEINQAYDKYPPPKNGFEYVEGEYLKKSTEYIERKTQETITVETEERYKSRNIREDTKVCETFNVSEESLVAAYGKTVQYKGDKIFWDWEVRAGKSENLSFYIKDQSGKKYNEIIGKDKDFGEFLIPKKDKYSILWENTGEGNITLNCTISYEFNYERIIVATKNYEKISSSKPEKIDVGDKWEEETKVTIHSSLTENGEEKEQSNQTITLKVEGECVRFERINTTAGEFDTYLFEKTDKQHNTLVKSYLSNKAKKSVKEIFYINEEEYYSKELISYSVSYEEEEGSKILGIEQFRFAILLIFILIGTISGVFYFKAKEKPTDSWKEFGKEEYPCSECGTSLIYVEKHKTWYCPECKKYEDKE